MGEELSYESKQDNKENNTFFKSTIILLWCRIFNVFGQAHLGFFLTWKCDFLSCFSFELNRTTDIKSDGVHHLITAVRFHLTCLVQWLRAKIKRYVTMRQTVTPVLSGTHIKRTPAQVPKFPSHVYLKANLYSADTSTERTQTPKWSHFDTCVKRILQVFPEGIFSDSTALLSASKSVFSR